MQVGHAFAAVTALVDDEAIARFGNAQLLGYIGSGEQKMSQESLIAGTGIPDARNELFGDDEHMNGCLGGDIMNRDAEFILVDKFRRDFAGNYLLENSFHGKAVDGSFVARIYRNSRLSVACRNERAAANSRMKVRVSSYSRRRRSVQRLLGGQWAVRRLVISRVDSE